MKLFLKAMRIAVYVGAAFMAGMLVDGAELLGGIIEGRSYALYVLIYTGGAFMAGLWLGQRWERSWQARQEVSEELSEEMVGEPASESDSDGHDEAAVFLSQEGEDFLYLKRREP